MEQIRIEQNYANQDCFLVEYDEDQWNRYDAETQQQCVDTWVKKAKPLGAEFVVLRLIPDPLFPSSDKAGPYIARSIPINTDTFDPFKLSAKLSCEIDRDTYWNASEGERMRLKTAARAKLAMNALVWKGCMYEVWVRLPHGEPHVIERSKF